MDTEEFKQKRDRSPVVVNDAKRRKLNQINKHQKITGIKRELTSKKTLEKNESKVDGTSKQREELGKVIKKHKADEDENEMDIGGGAESVESKTALTMEHRDTKLVKHEPKKKNKQEPSKDVKKSTIRNDNQRNEVPAKDVKKLLTNKEGPSKDEKKLKSINDQTKPEDGASKGEKKSKLKKDQTKQLDKDYNVLQFGDEMFEIIAGQVNEAYWAVLNVVKLLDSDHTVPFIARYRKEQTNNMDAKQIREVQELLADLRLVENKAASIYKQIEKQGKMSPEIEKSIQQARTVDDLDHIFASFKTGSKSSLAERAKKAGLEPASTRAFKNEPLNLHEFLIKEDEGCGTIEKLKLGVQHIIADVISKDKETMDYIRQLTSNGRTLITAEKSKSSVKEEKETKKANRQFETYFNFKMNVRDVKPHQMLAVNRGDALKELTVRLELAQNVSPTFKQWCQKKWITKNARADIRELFMSAIDDAYKRLIQPLLLRQIRSELTKSAEKASVEVFSQNLKRLLLTPPVRGKVILGLDPGFKNGCKAAIISETGAVLHTDVLYLLSKHNSNERNKLVKMVHQYKSDMVAIGNGTACRETEKTVGDLISKKAFSPLSVMYCIVNEDGASIYSVSDEAVKEMPDLDPNVRSAVSIARRLQDPLVELVKNNPKNIGVGMYQHDMPEKLMKTALDGVVEDCVSFVGIDLNVCSESLLRRISGLNTSRAKRIIEFRGKNGGFVNREQLLEIKGLGKKTFEQCAGFVRISDPINAQSTNSHMEETTKETVSNEKTKNTKVKKQKSFQVNPLDRTWIHPESYEKATEFLLKIGEEPESIGLPKMRNKINKAMETSSVKIFADELNVGEPTMQLIIDGLKQPLDYDIRAEYEKPLFKIGIMSMDDLKCGCVYPGRVTNVTHFGCFVDIGVQKSGLIHTSQMPNYVLKGRQLGPGDKVEVMVKSIEKERQRIQLKLVNLP